MQIFFPTKSRGLSFRGLSFRGLSFRDTLQKRLGCEPTKTLNVGTLIFRTTQAQENKKLPCNVWSWGSELQLWCVLFVRWTLCKIELCSLHAIRSQSKQKSDSSKALVNNTSWRWKKRNFFTWPREGPSGGEGVAFPAAIYVRRTPLICLAAILNMHEQQSHVTLRDLHDVHIGLHIGFSPRASSWSSNQIIYF